MHEEEYPENGHEKRRRHIENTILSAATELFREKGFAAVSISEISHAAGASRVTIYKYFGSKAGLIQRSIIHFLENEVRFYRDLVSRNSSFPDTVKSIVRRKYLVMREFNGELLGEITGAGPEFMDLILTMRRDAMNVVAHPILNSARVAGRIPKNIDDSDVIRFLDIVATGLIHSEATSCSTKIEIDTLEQILALTVRAIYGPDVTE